MGDGRPFDLVHEDPERGILLLHGFTGTPFEVRYLGERLHARGYSVVAPLLPGHGGTPAELNATTWHDWHAAVGRHLDALRARCRRVALVGFSLGGLLALHLASRRGAELAALASLGAPLWFPPPVTFGIRALRRIPGLVAVPKGGGGGPDVRDPEVRRQSPSLPAFPVRALGSLLDFTEVVRAELGSVRVPLFVAHARNDHVAPFACADELRRRVGSRDTRYLPLDRSFHQIPIDVEKDLLAHELGRFLDERMR